MQQLQLPFDQVQTISESVSDINALKFLYTTFINDDSMKQHLMESLIDKQLIYLKLVDEMLAENSIVSGHWSLDFRTHMLNY